MRIREATTGSCLRMSLSQAEIEATEEAFSNYDFNGNGTVDAFYLGRVLRTLGLKPSLRDIIKLGGSKNRGDGLIRKEKFLEIYCKAKTQSVEPPLPEDIRAKRQKLKNRSSSRLEGEEDREIPSEPSSTSLSTAALSLKTTKSRTLSISEVEEAKKVAAAVAEAALKPKRQMPLISMRTKGLIGNIVKNK